MADDIAAMRLMNFVSQEQLDESKKTRGERVEDGTAQRDRPLFQILKENKDKKDAEFNDRFKHRPPKPLDEDETDFLHQLDSSRKQYERQIAEEEAQQLRSFQAAVAAQSMISHEVKETSQASNANVQEEKRPAVKKSRPVQPLGMIIKVKPQAKKAKIDPSPQMGADKEGLSELHEHSCLLTTAKSNKEKNKECIGSSDSNGEQVTTIVTTNGLVSYSDESDDDEHL